MSQNIALLSSQDGYTVFYFNGTRILFKAPYSLEKYTSVKNWDHGYLEVMAKYRHNQHDEEEYIDLIPILQDLYINPDEFVDPIKEVRISYD